MYTHRIVVFALVLMSFGSHVRAEPTNEQLLLDPIVAEALAQNPEILAVRQRLLAAKERPAQVASLDDPELKIELWNTPDNLDVSRTSNTIFGLSQRFPYPGKRALKRSLTEKDAETVTAQIRAKEREIAAQVKGTYYELFLAHKAIEIHHRQIELLKDFFEIANARFRAGKGAQVDVLKSAVELSKLTNELPVLEQQQESAHARLNLLLSRAPSASLGLPVEPSGPRPRPSVEQLQQAAIQNRPELRVINVDMARSSAAIALSQRQFYPDFNVGVSRFQNYGTRDGFGGMVMMTVPFSFWTKPKYDAGVREAKANLEASKAVVHGYENQIRYEIADLSAKLDATQKLIALYKTTIIPQAQQTLESTRIGYQTAKVEFLTLLDAERALKDFQLEYYRSLTMFEQRMAELERTVGVDMGGNP